MCWEIMFNVFMWICNIQKAVLPSNPRPLTVSLILLQMAKYFSSLPCLTVVLAPKVKVFMTRIGLALFCLLLALSLAPQTAPAQSLSLQGSIELPACTAVDAVGPMVYTASASTFAVIDASNPAAPVVRGQVANSYGTFAQIAVSGGFAYCAAHGNGMVVYDVSDPVHPTFATRLAYANSVEGVAVRDTLAAMSSVASVALLGIRSPDHPHILATRPMQGAWVEFDPAGGRLHVGSPAGVSDLTIGTSVINGDTVFSLVNHHHYGTGVATPLALAGDYLDASTGASIITVRASDYTYLSTTPATAFIRAVTAVPNFLFLGIGTGTVTMYSQRRGLPEYPVSVGIPAQPTGLAPGQTDSQHFLAVSHNAGLSIVNYDTAAVSAGPVRPLPAQFSLTVYPNPFNPVATLQIIPPAPGRYVLMLYDALGRELQRENLTLSGEMNRRLDFSQRAPGLYFARLSRPGFSTTSKLLYLP
jgi:hypothetical protein